MLIRLDRWVAQWVYTSRYHGRWFATPSHPDNGVRWFRLNVKVFGRWHEIGGLWVSVHPSCIWYRRFRLLLPEKERFVHGYGPLLLIEGDED